MSTFLQYFFLTQNLASLSAILLTLLKLGYLKLSSWKSNVVYSRSTYENLRFISLFSLLLFHAIGSGIVVFDVWSTDRQNLSDLDGHLSTIPFICVEVFTVQIFLASASLLLLIICDQLAQVSFDVNITVHWMFNLINRYKVQVLAFSILLSACSVSLVYSFTARHPVATWFWLKNELVIFNIFSALVLITTIRVMLSVRNSIKSNSSRLNQGSTKSGKSMVAHSQERTVIRVAAISLGAFSSLISVGVYQILDDALNMRAQLYYDYDAKDRYQGIYLEIFHFAAGFSGMMFSSFYLFSQQSKAKASSSHAASENTASIKHTSQMGKA